MFRALYLITSHDIDQFSLPDERLICDRFYSLVYYESYVNLFPRWKLMTVLKKFLFQRAVTVFIYCLATLWASTALAQRGAPAQAGSNIRDSLVHKSLKEVLAGIKHLKEGKAGAIIQKFSGADPLWVWTIKEAPLPGHTNAITERSPDGVVTRLNYKKLKDATKLSVARTLIHEMMHAYLVLYFRYDGAAHKEYPQMVEAYRSVANPDLNSLHHKQMAISFVKEIAIALKEYGRSLDLKADDSLYTDLAWGGLDFYNNDQIEEDSKLRIQQRLNAEQFNASAYPIRPAGPEMSD